MSSAFPARPLPPADPIPSGRPANPLPLRRRILLAAINIYQRWISPRKGFACAYRVQRGGASCSTLGYRAIRRHGVMRGLLLLRERTARCGETHRAHRQFLAGASPLKNQRGDCDPGCDLPCDGGFELPDCDIPSGCDCGGWGRKERGPSVRRAPPRKQQGRSR